MSDAAEQFNRDFGELRSRVHSNEDIQGSYTADPRFLRYIQAAGYPVLRHVPPVRRAYMDGSAEVRRLYRMYDRAHIVRVDLRVDLDDRSAGSRGSVLLEGFYLEAVRQLAYLLYVERKIQASRASMCDALLDNLYEQTYWCRKFLLGHLRHGSWMREVSLGRAATSVEATHMSMIMARSARQAGGRWTSPRCPGEYSAYTRIHRHIVTLTPTPYPLRLRRFEDRSHLHEANWEAATLRSLFEVFAEAAVAVATADEPWRHNMTIPEGMQEDRYDDP